MLKWVSNSTLSELSVGTTSELFVAAEQTLNVSNIKYTIISGVLPDGLTLSFDGTICGQAAYDASGDYIIRVHANDIVNSETLEQDFNITIINPDEDNKAYTSLYFRPYLSLAKRREFNEFILNQSIFTPALLYRNNDLNFGIQRKLKMVLEFGAEQLTLAEYVYALYENYYRKRLRLGGIKTAIAKDASGTTVYEIIYVDVIDELKGAEQAIYSEKYDKLYYPGSIDNMKLQIQTLTLENSEVISLREDLKPRYMRTAQLNDSRTTTHINTVPLCYTLPGKSNIIVNRIQNSGFKFNTIDFEIDRVFVQQSLDNTTDKYLLFERETLSSPLSTDDILLELQG